VVVAYAIVTIEAAQIYFEYDRLPTTHNDVENERTQEMFQITDSNTNPTDSCIVHLLIRLSHKVLSPSMVVTG
jgi:hypothetical protein